MKVSDVKTDPGEVGNKEENKPNTAETNRIIDQFILGNPLEKEYLIMGKIKIKVRSVPDKVVSSIYKILAEQRDLPRVVLDNMYNDLLAYAYVTEFLTGTKREISFISDDLYSPESIKARLDYFDKELSISLKAAVVEKIKDFEMLLKDAFGVSSLNNF